MTENYRKTIEEVWENRDLLKQEHVRNAIEDGCFIGSRCIIVEAAKIGKEAVLGANVVITKSPRVINVSGHDPVEYKAFVPSRSVVIPGSYSREFPSGNYHVPCALIIGQRKTLTDLNTTLNNALRDYNVSI